MTRIPRSFAIGLVVVVLVVTGALVALARSQEARDASAGGPPSLPLPAEEWKPVASRCLAPAPPCDVPDAVEVDGNLLVRTSLQISPSYVASGAPASRIQVRVDLPDRRGWLMTGVIGGRASGYRVELPDRADEVATGRSLLLRVRGPRTAVPVVVTAREPRGSEGRQFVATFAYHP